MTAIQQIMVDGQLEPISHYCHAIRAGDRLWISGTVGVDADGNIPDDTVEQFRIAMDNIDQVLRAAGGRPEHIVKVTLYLTDVDDRQRINPIRQAYWGEHRPASTLVGVAALALPGLKIEIDAEAVIA
jgi:enamine deaminase RidA (YjgF/YER057c/UK114 family)